MRKVQWEVWFHKSMSKCAGNASRLTLKNVRIHNGNNMDVWYNSPVTGRLCTCDWHCTSILEVF